MHYYKFHITDYRSGTAHLTNEEDLCYRRLIDMYYDTENEIPLETQWVARRIRVETEIVERVLNDMFERRDTGWFHARCDAELRDMLRRAEVNKMNGGKGGRPKKSPIKPNGNPMGCEWKPNVGSGSMGNGYLEEKELVVSSTGITAEEIYSAYPRKVGKGAAIPAIKKAMKKVSAEKLLEKVKAYATSREGKDQQFTPNPATWFNQERWLDDGQEVITNEKTCEDYSGSYIGG